MQLVLLASMIALGAPSVAWAQDDFKQDVEQCRKAEDVSFCPIGLSACERLLAGMAAVPANLDSDKFRLTVLGISTGPISGFVSSLHIYNEHITESGHLIEAMEHATYSHERW